MGGGSGGHLILGEEYPGAPYPHMNSCINNEYCEHQGVWIGSLDPLAHVNTWTALISVTHCKYHNDL